MASHTDINLRSMMVYQVFVRQHSAEGNFAGVINDLDRIKGLGTDILYLLPIHPIGEKDRKGSLGSPYSIKDHKAIDPAYGNEDDFKRLIAESRHRGMKVMMDIVINHTSRDSVLTDIHPEWFYRTPEGAFRNRVGDWSDITDLDFNLLEVRSYFKQVLVDWAKLVDGFRCDVAPMLPMEFWREVKAEINDFNKDFIWLSESVHLSFIKYLRDSGFECASDSMIYDVFDMAYDYDIFDHMDHYLRDPGHLSRWLEEIIRQESVYPKNYVKLRGFENHDQARLMSKVRDDKHFKQMLALQFFIKGTPMVYAGMEHMVDHRPDLFEDDKVPWNEAQSVESLIHKLSTMKKQPIFAKGVFNHIQHDQAAIFTYDFEETYLIGIFNLEHAETITLNLKDGQYQNLLTGQEITIKDSILNPLNEPLILIARQGDKR